MKYAQIFRSNSLFVFVCVCFAIFLLLFSVELCWVTAANLIELCCYAASQ